MKKATLILLTSLALTSSLAHADGHGKKQYLKHMTHANPLPNYVSVIKKNAEKLGLSAEQASQVKAWNQSNAPKMRDLVMAVVEREAEIKRASLEGKSAEDILKIADSIQTLRLNIIKGKTRCRDHIKSILNDAQWTKLTAMISHENRGK